MLNKNDYKAAFSKVTASEETYRRVMRMTKERKPNKGGRALSRIVLIAAVISLLAVTVSASELVRSWFAGYFSNKTGEPLSQEQIEFIEENEKHLDESLTQNGWTIELRSAITDGIKGYIMLAITAPEDISLDEIPEKSYTEYYGPGNDYLPKDPDTVLSCSAYPDYGGVLGNIGSSWQADGDGLSNTLYYVIDVSPDVEWAEENPFSGETGWHIHIENLVCGFPEQTLMAEGIWDFDFTFHNNNWEVELLAEPMKTQAWAYLPDGTEIETEVTAVSITLRPFGVTVYYGDDSDGLDYSRTSVCFAGNVPDRTPWFAVMKDGSKMELITAGGNPIEGYQYLETKLPIVLENVAYLLLADGTQIPLSE